MSRKIGLPSQFLAILLLATIITGCGGPANTASVVTERPAGPADKVELVMFHFTQR